MRSWFPCACWLMLAGCQSGSKATASFAAPPPAVSPSLHASAPGAFASADYGKLPLAFEPNVGQTDARVQFLARGSGYSLFLGRERAVLALQRGRSHASVIEMELLGASTGAAPGAGREPLPGKVNYYRGSDPKQWHENVPTYAKVAYPGVYPGIDLVYYGRGGELEYDFVVRPGADSARIHLGFGRRAPTLDAKGDLVVSLDGGEVRLPKPVVYQEKNGRRQRVDGRFALAGDHEVRFEVAAYDARLALVIDPTIVYSTYLGGSGADGSDGAFGLAVDSAGSAIVVGWTPSSTFPTTTGALSTTFESHTRTRRRSSPSSARTERRSSSRRFSAGRASATDTGKTAGRGAWRSVRRTTFTWRARRTHRVFRRPRAAIKVSWPRAGRPTIGLTSS
jgi:hypothetical protein